MTVSSLASLFRRYLLPGFVFQSVVIAGGYGTGRELVEFFLSYGPRGGLLAMLLVSTVVWSAVCAVSFELARVHRTYDYRRFFKLLLGRAWFLFEICYVALLLIVLAVIAAAAGEILREVFGLPYAVGVLGMTAAVGALVFAGTGPIERFLAGWSLVLYAVYAVFCAWSLVRFGPEIGDAFRTAAPAGIAWIRGGVEYAAYNLAVIPPVLFAVRHVERRREALTAGLMAGPIAMTPALLFFVAVAGQYPAILDEPVPANAMLELLGSRGFQLVFQLVLFGTLIETGTGLIHAVNERIAGRFADDQKELPRWVRPAVAVALLAVGAGVARFGLIALIARGYGTLTWAFLLVFVVPVLTVGVWKVMGRRGRLAAVTLLTLFGASTGPLEAQMRPRAGDRVRVGQGRWIPPSFRDPGSAFLEGRFEALVNDTLLLRVRRVRVRIPVRIPGPIEVREVVGHRAREGAIVGGGIGLAMGAILAGTHENEPARRDRDRRFLTDGQIAGILASTLAGAGIGALVGRAIEDAVWRPMDRERGAHARAGVTPAGRVSLGVRVPVGGR